MTESYAQGFRDGESASKLKYEKDMERLIEENKYLKERLSYYINFANEMNKILTS